MPKIFAKFVHNPLSTSLSISPVGGVPPVQMADSMGSLSVDYTKTPLTLDPVLSVRNPDTGLAIDNDMENVASLLWEQISGSTVTAITASTSGYTLVTSGANRGRLQLKRNLAEGESITLRLTITYHDPRTGETLKRVATQRVQRRSSASARPRLRLSVPRLLAYNPLRHPSDIKISAMLTGGGRAWKAPVYCGYIWEKWTGSAWRRILLPSDAGYEFLDYDVEISVDTASITVHRSMMGQSLRIRCRAWYLDAQTNTPVGATSATYNGVAPVDECCLERHLPPLHYDIQNVGWQMSPGTQKLMPKAVVSDSHVIPNPASELLLSWKAGPPGAMKQIGTGEQVTVDISSLSQGSVAIDLDASDRGSWCAATDASGAILTDASGAVLLIR